MIKLTVLQYKLKVTALEKYHNINEHNQGLIYNWEQEQEKAKAIDGEYPTKSFIEPFEFEHNDYTVEEKKFRVRLKDIYSYKENTDNIVVVSIGLDENFTVKETIEEIDALFGI